MKKIIIIALACSLFTTSCLTLAKSRGNLVLVDAPKDITVSVNGTVQEVTKVTAFVDSRTVGNVTTKTYYKYPGVKDFKIRKTMKVDIKHENRTVNVPVKTKRAVGLLILEGVLTFGIATLVDLATGNSWVIKNRFIDVPATLNKTTPRSNKELMLKVRKDFAE
jgi:hypothetical protein